MPANDSLLDRVWDRLQNRYEIDGDGCSCSVDDETVAALERSDLTGADIDAYRRGDVSLAELVGQLDVEVDPTDIDDRPDLAEAAKASQPADAGNPP